TKHLDIYVSTPSIRAGDALVAHAAIDDFSTAADVFWRILKVQTINSQAYHDQLTPETVVDSSGGNTVHLPGLTTIPFNRDQIGFGWPILPLPLNQNTGGWLPGLYAIQVNMTSDFTQPPVGSQVVPTAYFI